MTAAAQEPEEPEEEPEEERDGELYQLLHDVKFEGPVWDHVSSELVGYSILVCAALISSGKIFDLCGKAGRGLARPPRSLSENDVEWLTIETVGEGILSFQEALREGRWTPNGSAKMTTSVIGYCVGDFPNVWRRWSRGYTAFSAVEIASMQEAEAAPAADYHSDPGGWIDLWETLEEEVPNETLRKILVLESMGYRHAEIAEILGGLTEAAVTERLGRYRRRRARGRRA
jgi:hypothetical protein